MTDKFQERIDSADSHIAGVTRFDEIVVNKVTILAHEHQEALTFISENDTTYPFIRWLNRAGQFLFGLVAHEKKWVDSSDPSLGKKVDKHFSMYRANEDMESRTGFFDAEWGEADPMLKIEDTQVRFASSNANTEIIMESPNGSKWSLTVDDNGNVDTAPAVGLRADSVLEETS